MTSLFGVAPSATSSYLISDRSLAALSILTENSENSRVARSTGPSLLIARLHHSFPDEPQKPVASRQVPGLKPAGPPRPGRHGATPRRARAPPPASRLWRRRQHARPGVPLSLWSAR